VTGNWPCSFKISINSLGYSPRTAGSKKLRLKNKSAIRDALKSAGFSLLGYDGVKFRIIPIFPFLISNDRKASTAFARSEEHTSELQSRFDLVCRLLLEKKN